jgi:hypothetical protein
MTKHDFDLDDAVSVAQFFSENKVSKKNQKCMLKTCTSSEGETFKAVGFTNGSKLSDGRLSYTFFVLSQKLQDEGVVLNREFLHEHKSDLQLLECDDLKFGIAFLPGGGIDWEDI